jgi:CheY-like chemotaxis protein
MMNRKHILVADDEPGMIRSLRFILSAAGYHVSTAADGQEALDKILEAKQKGEFIDLLITDLFMPHMSGFRLMSELTKHDLSIPTIAITGFGHESTTQELERRGCGECIYKPFEDKQILDRVAQVLTRCEQGTGCEKNVSQ